jgi:purine-binding chemotaxis protein CheW
MNWNIVKERLEKVQQNIERPGTDQLDRRSQVLLDRAQVLSAPERVRVEDDHDRVLVFRLGSDRHAIPLSEVVEIVADVRRAIVPGAPQHVAGLVQVRGEVRPAYRLEKLVPGAAGPSYESETALLVRSSGRDFALLVSEIEDVRSVQAASRRPAPPAANHVRWMTEDLIPVLDTASIFGDRQ